MVGDTGERDDQRFVRQRVEKRFAAGFRLATDGEDAAMDLKPGDFVHDRGAGGVDGNVPGNAFDQVAEPRNAVFAQKHAFCLEPARGEKHVQHHAAFGHEPPLPADEVAFADVPIGGYAWIVGALDGKEFPFHAASPARASFAMATRVGRIWVASLSGAGKKMRSVSSPSARSSPSGSMPVSRHLPAGARAKWRA